MADEPSPGVFSAKELAVIRICKKAGKVPCKLNVNDIADMAAVLSAREQESVINILALFGFLNRFMDTIGMTLEMEQIKMGKEHLVESGWKAENVYDPEADVELMEDDKVEAEKRERRKRNEVIRMLFGAKQEDSVLMEQIPSSFSAVEKRCREVAGFVPYYVTKPIHGNARMALSWAFLLRLNEGSEEVPPQLKQIMGYVIATNVDNTILRAHYAFMAFRGGVSIEGLCSATRIINPEDDLSAEEVGAIALAEAASFTPSTMTPTLVGLLSRLFSPAGVIELVNTVSVVFVFHRWSVVYVPNTYEPELLEFLKEHGEALGIDPVRPCTEEEATFDHVAAAVRAGDKSYMRKAAGE